MVISGAIPEFVKMASQSSRGSLRAMCVETLRVLSEDTFRTRRTPLVLCENGAAGALGFVMNDDVSDCGDSIVASEANDATSMLDDGGAIKELHEALCTLSNILDYDAPQASTPIPLSYQTSIAVRYEGDDVILVNGFIEFIEAGGLESLLKIVTFPIKPSDPGTQDMLNESNLVSEACRSLASLSSLLLSDSAAYKGYAAWTVVMLKALMRVFDDVSQRDGDTSSELKFDVLRGIGALAAYEPHKLAIIDKYLPSLFHAKNGRGDDPVYISGAAGHVCTSLGLSDDDFAKKIAGNDPKLMGDWFCMQRSLLLQSMAKAEMLKIISAVWEEPFNDILKAGQVPTELWRSTSKESQRSKESASSGHLSLPRSESGGGQQTLEDIFECLAFEDEDAGIRNTILQQYHHVYEMQIESGRDPFSSQIVCNWNSQEPDSESLLSSHVYPLDSPTSEKDWVLSHRNFVQNGNAKLAVASSGSLVNRHVQDLMDSCVPSRLIQHSAMPIFDIRPESSFDIRSLIMPQRRYFSFRKEGQLVSQLCDINAADDTHWTLAFTNSSFAGEFSETLVQALYRCPMIRGISFTRNKNWRLVWGVESEAEGKATSTMLANIAGSLPPWVSSLVYDNTLTDSSLQALSDVLETLGRLSTLSGSQSSASTMDERNLSQLGQQQGSFESFAILNSPHLGPKAWKEFFGLLGRSPSPDRSSSLKSHPLETLRILDVSGNSLGDAMCASVLARALSEKSGCRLEQLNLAGNEIRQGKDVAKVLNSYVDQYRSNQSAGVFVERASWKSSLAYLNLSSNELSAGGLALEIVVLLRNNALNLKSLDLSDNHLECDGFEFTQNLIGSLVKNTSLRHLNLSGNDFSRQCIDGLLDGLTRSDSDSSLAFLRLDDNLPPLTDQQRRSLHNFEYISRTILLRRYLNDRERMRSGELEDMDILDDGPMATLREDKPSYAPRPSLERKTSEQSTSLISVADSATASDDGSARRAGRRTSVGTKGENMITVLFSAPLVYQDSDNNYHPFAKLDFGMERELLWQCLKEARRDIELFFDNATHHRLLAAKTKRCGVLHYSGHGHQTHLPFENGKGGPHWLEVDLLKSLLEQDEGAPFKFVFVSACHSLKAGRTFAAARVPHVVCCQQESEVKDAAALAFTRQFYLALAVGQTVRESFEQGCRAVRGLPNLRHTEAEDEMKKFVLLPEDGNHDVRIFANAKRVREWPRTAAGGPRSSLQRSKSSRRSATFQDLSSSRSIYLGGTRSSELSVRNMMQEDPSPTPPQFFMGREIDMYRVLNSVLSEQRLVSVLGEKGLGRSSLVYALCHYLNERRSTVIEYIERIYFVRATQNRGSNRFVAVLRELLKKLIMDQPLLQQDPGELDMESLINVICKALNKTKALLVIDRTEFLEGSDKQDLIVFLSNLFQETKTKHVRVLLTGREPLGIASIGGVPEKGYPLGPLTFQNTVTLFSNLCPHLHTPADRKRFINRVAPNSDGQSGLLPTDKGLTERTKFIFRTLGDGVPSRIENAAATVTSEVLDRLGAEDETASAVTW